MKPDQQSGRLGVVLIGTGGIGKFHLKTWQDIPTAEVVGVYDLDPAAARAAAELHGVDTVYTSLAEAVAEPRAAAADICTPNMFHREGTVAALAAGKHVLCEKPLAATVADIEAMIAARDAAARKQPRSAPLLMTCQHLRFEQRTRALERVIAAGRLGEPYYGRAWWLRRRLAPATPGFLSRAQAGFGPGMDIGVHMLDLAMHLLGQPRPVSVTGVAAAKLAHQENVCNQWGPFRSADFEVEDFAAGFIRFANGAALTLEVSWLLNQSAPESYGLQLYGTAGGVYWPELKLAHVQDGLLLDSQIASETGADGHKHALAAFAAAALQGRGPSPVPAEESLVVGRVLAGLYESAAAANREVPLP